MMIGSLCILCGTLILSVTADISDTDATKSSSSNWFEDIQLIENKSYQIWILSIIASCIIGLSGILPLVIIPFESGAKFDQKGDNKLLRLLLSFAVGGLLGDVFLHLLPEAWNHIEYLGPELHSSHLVLGLWVLLGMFSFVILEMMFTASQEKDNSAKTVAPVSSNHLYSEKKENSHSSEILYNGNSKHSCSELQQKPMQNGFSKHAQNGTVKESPESLSPIHVAGYLNLMANSIDNFTHGLAVAASFLVGIKMGLLTTFAILIHEIPHEFGDFAILLKSGFKPYHAVRAQLSTASVGVLGAIVALSAESADKVGSSTLWILPFTSGGFLNIALVNVLPDLLKEKDPWESMKQMACLCGGIGVMALVNILVH